MKVTALLPCRKGSERVIQKNIKDFAGTSLFDIKIKQLINTPEIDAIIVSTDDEAIIKKCQEIDNKKIEIHERDPASAKSSINTDQLIAYFAKSLDVEGDLLWTHVTSPFITEKVYSAAIKKLQEVRESGAHDSLVSVSPVKEFVWDAQGKPINYGTYEGRWPKTQDVEELYIINSGIFLIPFALMKEKSDRVGEKPYMYPCNQIESLDVDTEEDFNVCETLWKAYKN